MKLIITFYDTFNLMLLYCRDQNEENEDSCARVDAILIRRKDSKSHVKGK